MLTSMTLDFSTISLSGIVTITILCAAFCCMLFIILRYLRNVKIKTERLSLETAAYSQSVEKIMERGAENDSETRSAVKKTRATCKTPYISNCRRFTRTIL